MIINYRELSDTLMEKKYTKGFLTKREEKIYVGTVGWIRYKNIKDLER